MLDIQKFEIEIQSNGKLTAQHILRQINDYIIQLGVENKSEHN